MTGVQTCALPIFQTGKIRHFPIVLVGTEFYGGLIGWIRERLLGEGMIVEADLDLLAVTDDPAEVVRIIRTSSRRRIGEAATT